MARHDHHHDHGHAHAHGHAHGPDRGHAHGDPTNAGRAFALAIALNTVFVGVEFGYGLLANSTALMADAGHNLSDVLGLALAWGAALLSRRAPSERFTFGLRGSSILAALANATLLLVACGGIGWEAIRRFAEPPTVASNVVMVVAAVGIVVNGVSAWLFARGSAHDLNQRGAYLHLLADAGVSLGVVVGGLVMRQTGWYLIDPLLSLVIVVVILFSTWGLLRESVNLALAAVPSHVEVAAVRAYLLSLPGVSDVHDLHIWALSTTETALTVRLVTPDGPPGDAFIDQVANELEERFAIHHSTLQLERGTIAQACRLQGDKSHGLHDHDHDHAHPASQPDAGGHQ
ncbi:MAG TPA: cation diffusion facilitator family transporter [Ideonella sp.]|uniref:cation diffusion facilitator family transporter n=1 Tax=Ideonella sp. TaxID=1929293 RepID=UPI002E30E6F9|nr:cation diffusion facilitator family transporter [Ideonella sp.]HEX5683783.1 cation diffusion facilitator family transporter [Ideonella sp.]